jgi:beta-glucosidase
LQSRSTFGQKEVHPQSVFSEGLAIDYKWFDKWDIKPRYEFGFGLRYVGSEEMVSIRLLLTFSYSTFEMSGLNLTSVHRKDQDSIQPTREKYLGSAGLYDILVCMKTVPNHRWPFAD